MKLAIIGSRSYTNRRKIKQFLFDIRLKQPDTEIVSGGADDGADKYAKQVALEFELKYTEFPPEHETYNMYCVKEPHHYGKPYNVGYYHKRNKELVEYVDKVIAFCTDGVVTNGTKSALEHCEKIQKKYIILD